MLPALVPGSRGRGIIARAATPCESVRRLAGPEVVAAARQVRAPGVRRGPGAAIFGSGGGGPGGGKPGGGGGRASELAVEAPWGVAIPLAAGGDSGLAPAIRACAGCGGPQVCFIRKAEALECL